MLPRPRRDRGGFGSRRRGASLDGGWLVSRQSDDSRSVRLGRRESSTLPATARSLSPPCEGGVRGVRGGELGITNNFDRSGSLCALAGAPARSSRTRTAYQAGVPPGTTPPTPPSQGGKLRDETGVKSEAVECPCATLGTPSKNPNIPTTKSRPAHPHCSDMMRAPAVKVNCQVVSRVALLKTIMINASETRRLDRNSPPSGGIQF